MQRVLWCLMIVSCCGSARAEPAHWIEVRSPHFDVFSNASEAEARHAAGQMEEARAAFLTQAPVVKAVGEMPLVVFALADATSFAALARTEHFNTISTSFAEGGDMIEPEGMRIIVMRLHASGEYPYWLIYGNYMSYLLRGSEMVLPPWVNAGLTEFCANLQIRGTEFPMGPPSHFRVFAPSSTAPLKTLLAADYNSDLYNNDYGFGYQSWALVDLLKIGDAKHKTTHFNDYVSSVMIGENPVTAAEHSFGDLKKLQVVVDAYAAQFAYESYPVTLSASALPDEASFQLSPVSQADVDAQRSRVLIGVGRPEDAERLLRAVLKQDPTNALAHETMGLLKERKGDFNAAKDWYSKALRLNPKDAQAAAGLARACMKTKDASRDAEIEAALRLAIQTLPNYAPAYDALGSLYGERGRNLEEAKQLIIRAVHLEPDTVQYREDAANVLVAAKQVAEAIKVLTAAEQLPDRTNERKTLARRIAELERPGTAVSTR